MDEPKDAPGWTETESREFLDLAPFFVPEREEQAEALVALIPESPRRVVELCCGEGRLSGAVLDRFPECEVLALDGSPAMIEHATTALSRHHGRFEARLFDLADPSWRRFPWPVDAFLSSLAIHHLDGEGKRALYRDLARALAPGGAIAIADLIEPRTEAAKRLAARAWDESVRRRSLEIAGHLGPFETFRAKRWNLYAESEPDPIDHPSPLIDQLRWLEEAGLAGADVVWMKAGHAVFGAYRPS